MKKLIGIILLVFCHSLIYAQNYYNVVTGLSVPSFQQTTVNTVVNGTTLTDITGSTITLDDNKVYMIDYFIGFLSNDVNFGSAWAVNGTVTFGFINIDWSVNLTPTSKYNYTAQAFGSYNPSLSTNGLGINVMKMNVIIATANGGTITLQTASEDPTGVVAAFQGCTIIVRELTP